MAWIVRCLYRPGGAQQRLPLRADHIRHMLHWLPQTVFGAALLDADDRDPVGMLVAIDVPSREEAQRFIDAEPYCSAGLFATIEITPAVQMTPPHTPEHLLGELKKCT